MVADSPRQIEPCAPGFEYRLARYFSIANAEMPHELTDVFPKLRLGQISR
jgi:hypothetical protein